MLPRRGSYPLKKAVKEEINERGETFSRSHQMGSVLRPREEAVHFGATPKIALIQNGERSVYNIAEGAGVLERHGVDHVEFSVSIEYSDVVGNHHAEFTFSGESEIWDGMIFDDMYH